MSRHATAVTFPNKHQPSLLVCLSVWWCSNQFGVLAVCLPSLTTKCAGPGFYHPANPPQQQSCQEHANAGGGSSRGRNRTGNKLVPSRLRCAVSRLKTRRAKSHCPPLPPSWSESGHPLPPLPPPPVRILTYSDDRCLATMRQKTSTERDGCPRFGRLLVLPHIGQIMLQPHGRNGWTLPVFCVI